jgi:hypothetical protein
MSKHEQIIMKSTDLDALRKALIDANHLNTRLHRRVQVAESTVIAIETEKRALEESLNYWRVECTRLDIKDRKMNRALREMPGPLHWLIRRYFNKVGLV